MTHLRGTENIIASVVASFGAASLLAICGDHATKQAKYDPVHASCALPFSLGKGRSKLFSQSIDVDDFHDVSAEKKYFPTSSHQWDSHTRGYIR